MPTDHITFLHSAYLRACIAASNYKAGLKVLREDMMYEIDERYVNLLLSSQIYQPTQLDPHSSGIRGTMESNQFLSTQQIT